VDLDCGAATDIVLLDADGLPEALEMMRSHARGEVIEESLAPAEWRWHVENALGARGA